MVEWWDADNLIQAPLVALWLLIPIHWWWCILGQEMIQHDYDESDHDCMRVVLNRQSQCISWWYIIVVMFNNKSNCFICHANLTLIQIKFIKNICVNSPLQLDLWVSVFCVSFNNRQMRYMNLKCLKSVIEQFRKMWNFSRLSPTDICKLEPKKISNSRKERNGCKLNFPI